MYRRTTIAAAATALALLGGGSALAANAGLLGSGRPDTAGTLPAVSTLDPAPSGDTTPSTARVEPVPGGEDPAEDDSPAGDSGEQESDGEVDDD